MGRVNKKPPPEGSSFQDSAFDAAVARAASDTGYLGSFDQLYALVQGLGAELCQKLDDPDMDEPTAMELAVQIIEPVVQRILQDDGTWYSADRLKHQLELADPSNAGPDLAYVLREFFYQYTIEVGQLLRYANAPGVLPEQWNWQPKAINTRACLLLHGYEIEDDETFDAYNDFVSGRMALPQVVAITESEGYQQLMHILEEHAYEYEKDLREEAQPRINVVINMPEQRQPDVVVHNHIENPAVVVNPPDIVVNVTPELTMKPVASKVTRDAEGRITGVVPEGES